MRTRTTTTIHQHADADRLDELVEVEVDPSIEPAGDVLDALAALLVAMHGTSTQAETERSA